MRKCTRRALLVATLLAVAALRAPGIAWSQIPLGNEFAVNVFTTSAQVNSSVTWDAQGRFVVAWTSDIVDGSDFGIVARRYAPSGVPEGGLEFRVNVHTAGRQQSPAVAAAAADGFVVAWQSIGPGGTTYAILAQRFDGSGLPLGEFGVNTYTTSLQSGPAVASNGAGGFVVAWTGVGPGGGGLDVHARRYDATGTAQGEPFRVNVYTSGVQSSPSVAADAAGNFVVTWSSGLQDGSAYGVFGRRFDAAGQPLGPEFAVNTFTAGSQGSSGVAARPDGSFVVLWRSDAGDTSEGAIIARLYDADGDPRGAPFLVNQYVTGDQFEPAVTMDAHGNFVAVWGSDGQDEGSFGVFGRAFGADGSPVGPEFRVSAPVGTIRRFPAVSAEPSGRFVVTWQSYQDGSAAGIRARRYQRDLIFRDGFDTGSLSAWSTTSTDGGDLTVSALAALKLSAAGLRGLVDDTAGLFVQDDTPADEDVYIARFYFDPNGFDPGEGLNHFRTRIFLVFEEAPNRRLAALVLRRIGGQYSLRARARQDDQSQADSPFIPIDDGPHFVEILWVRSGGPDASNGGLLMWIDGSLMATLGGLDNSLSAVDFVRLGALSVKVGANGTLFWDEFESRRGTLVGP